MPESSFRTRVNIWAFERLHGEPALGGGSRKTVSPRRAGRAVTAGRQSAGMAALAAMAVPLLDAQESAAAKGTKAPAARPTRLRACRGRAVSSPAWLGARLARGGTEPDRGRGNLPSESGHGPSAALRPREAQPGSRWVRPPFTRRTTAWSRDASPRWLWTHPTRPAIASYVGTTGGGVWRSQNAGTSNPASIVFTPLTDDLAAMTSAMESSISIGALTVQPGGTGVILAGTGDPTTPSIPTMAREFCARPTAAPPGA